MELRFRRSRERGETPIFKRTCPKLERKTTAKIRVSLSKADPSFQVLRRREL